MDAAHIFRQGMAPMLSRPNPTFANPPQQQQHQHQLLKPPPSRDDTSDGDASGQRIAHTLTACCRCRQRKTRCDPTLPRCLPCERSGSTCEYLDAAKGRKINRYYVIKLQDKVRALEAELSQFTDDEGEGPRSNEDMVRPGGMVRLSASDETPRYLGPSSGIAMTRLLMEEAKRFTDSKRISDLIPELRARTQARMQSIQVNGPSAGRKKSYPMISEHPAEHLPSREVAEKLVEIFNQKAQSFWPVLHEKDFKNDMEAVYGGDNDPYRLFIVRMVIAISLQKLDAQYAGLADSYYLAAMQLFEDVIRSKDLKTLQCLVLIGQYSLLTPTRTPIYYVVGLATRICQQEGWADEKTIATGFDLDPKTVDMRRRVLWTVVAMEYGLAHSMGRPNNFATGGDRIDVDFFATVDDENITENGIQPGPPNERKLVAVHFFKMRICQAEIRRSLYEKKRPEPKNDSHPWYARVEGRIQEWLDASPTNPPWCKAWFTGRYHQMKIFLYRPSPQVPKPSPRAASICFESSKFIIDLSSKQVDGGALDITWIFLLTVTMSLNTLLWTVSYPDIRQAHSRDEVERLVNKALLVLDRCSERWPGTGSASQLYAIFSKACLQSYETRHTPGMQTPSLFNTPPSFADPNSPESYHHAVNPPQVSFANPPHFGYVFDSPPEAMTNYAFDPNFPPPQPTFRSNSIFCNPASTESTGRRFSYFPPDFTQSGDTAPDDPTPPATATPEPYMSSPLNPLSEQLPTPPDSTLTGTMATPAASSTLSPSVTHHTPGSSPMPTTLTAVHNSVSPSPKIEPQSVSTTFSTPTQPMLQQRPLPPVANSNNWFSPPPSFITPYSFGNTSNNNFSNGLGGAGGFSNISGASGLGLQNFNIGTIAAPPFNYNPGRQGSLTQSQQMELMDDLEMNGVGDIDAFLNGTGINEERWY